MAGGIHGVEGGGEPAGPIEAARALEPKELDQKIKGLANKTIFDSEIAESKIQIYGRVRQLLQSEGVLKRFSDRVSEGVSLKKKEVLAVKRDLLQSLTDREVLICCKNCGNNYNEIAEILELAVQCRSNDDAIQLIARLIDEESSKTKLEKDFLKVISSGLKAFKDGYVSDEMVRSFSTSMNKYLEKFILYSIKDTHHIIRYFFKEMHTNLKRLELPKGFKLSLADCVQRTSPFPKGWHLYGVLREKRKFIDPHKKRFSKYIYSFTDIINSDNHEIIKSLFERPDFKYHFLYYQLKFYYCSACNCNSENFSYIINKIEDREILGFRDYFVCHLENKNFENLLVAIRRAETAFPDPQKLYNFLDQLPNYPVGKEITQHFINMDAVTEKGDNVFAITMKQNCTWLKEQIVTEHLKNSKGQGLFDYVLEEDSKAFLPFMDELIQQVGKETVREDFIQEGKMTPLFASVMEKNIPLGVIGKKLGIDDGQLRQALLSYKGPEGNIALHYLGKNKDAFNDILKQLGSEALFVENNEGVSPWDLFCLHQPLEEIVAHIQKENGHDALVERALAQLVKREDPKEIRTFLGQMLAMGKDENQLHDTLRSSLFTHMEKQAKGTGATHRSVHALFEMLTFLDNVRQEPLTEEEIDSIVHNLNVLLYQAFQYNLDLFGDYSKTITFFQTLQLPLQLLDKIAKKAVALEEFPTGWGLYSQIQQRGWEPTEQTQQQLRWETLSKLTEGQFISTLIIGKGEELILTSLPWEKVDRAFVLKLATVFSSDELFDYILNKVRNLNCQPSTSHPLREFFELEHLPPIGVAFASNSVERMKKLVQAGALFNIDTYNLADSFAEYPPQEEMLNYLFSTDYRDSSKRNLFEIAIAKRNKDLITSMVSRNHRDNKGNDIFQSLGECRDRQTVKEGLTVISEVVGIEPIVNSENIQKILSGKNGVSSFEELLKWCEENGHFEALKRALFDEKWKPEPLYIAAARRGVNLFQEKFGAPISLLTDYKDAQQNTLWHLLAKEGQFELFVTLLVDRKIKQEFEKTFHEKNEQGFTLLHEAILKKQYAFIERFADRYGFDFRSLAQVPDSKGNTFLHLDVIHNQFAMRQFAERQGIIDYTSQNGEGNTVMHLLLQSSRFTQRDFNTLLGDPRFNTIQNNQQQYPLHCLLKNPRFTWTGKHTKEATKLFKSYFGKEMLTPDADGNTPLHLAFQHNPSWVPYIFHRMKKAEIDLKRLNVANKEGKFLLHLATKLDSFLLLYKMDRNILTKRDSQGDTPLHRLFSQGKLKQGELIELVGRLDQDALREAVSVSNNKGKTLLHLAAERGYNLVFSRVCIDQNLQKIAEEGPMGVTPFDLAYEAGYDVLARMIFQAQYPDLSGLPRTLSLDFTKSYPTMKEGVFKLHLDKDSNNWTLKELVAVNNYLQSKIKNVPLNFEKWVGLLFDLGENRFHVPDCVSALPKTLPDPLPNLNQLKTWYRELGLPKSSSKGIDRMINVAQAYIRAGTSEKDKVASKPLYYHLMYLIAHLSSQDHADQRSSCLGELAEAGFMCLPGKKREAKIWYDLLVEPEKAGLSTEDSICEVACNLRTKLISKVVSEQAKSENIDLAKESTWGPHYETLAISLIGEERGIADYEDAKTDIYLENVRYFGTKEQFLTIFDSLYTSDELFHTLLSHINSTKLGGMRQQYENWFADLPEALEYAREGRMGKILSIYDESNKAAGEIDPDFDDEIKEALEPYKLPSVVVEKLSLPLKEKVEDVGEEVFGKVEGKEIPLLAKLDIRDLTVRRTLEFWKKHYYENREELTPLMKKWLNEGDFSKLKKWYDDNRELKANRLRSKVEIQTEISADYLATEWLLEWVEKGRPLPELEEELAKAPVSHKEKRSFVNTLYQQDEEGEVRQFTERTDEGKEITLAKFTPYAAYLLLRGAKLIHPRTLQTARRESAPSQVPNL